MLHSFTARLSLATLFLLALILASAKTEAQTIAQVKLAPGDLNPSALFGNNLAATANFLVAAAPQEDTGSVYVYQRNGVDWLLDAKLQAPDGVSHLSGGVSIYGDTIISCASGGQAFVFERINGTWVTTARLVPNDSSTTFGGAVSLSKDRVAIAGSGSAYIFAKDDTTGQWVQEAKFTGVFGFGFSLALDDNTNTLVVGSPFTGLGSASVFVRQHGAWSQQAVLAGDPLNAGLFGLGTAVSGNTIVVGAPGSGPDEDQQGSAYVFVNNNGTWSREAKLMAPAAVSGAGDEFGTSVALIGNTLLVGAYENPFNLEAGTAHVFVRDSSGWSVAQFLQAADGVSNQRFANSVTMADSKTFICGSPTASAPLFNSGAVYSFTLP